MSVPVWRPVLLAAMCLAVTAAWSAAAPRERAPSDARGAGAAPAPVPPVAPDPVARWRAMYGDDAVVRLAGDVGPALAARPLVAPRGGALLLAPPGRTADARPLAGPLRAALARRGWLALSLAADAAALGPALEWLRQRPAAPVVVVAIGAAAATALEAAQALAAGGARGLVLVDAAAGTGALDPALARLEVLELIGARAPRALREAARERLRAALEGGVDWRMHELQGLVAAAEDWRLVLARVDAWGRARVLAAGAP